MVICGQEFEFSLMNANDLDRFEDANARMQHRSAEESEQFQSGGIRLGDHARAQARIAMDCIDEILGAGASARLGLNENYMAPIYDVIEELGNAFAAEKQRYTARAAHPMNREQRRAVAKQKKTVPYKVISTPKTTTEDTFIRGQTEVSYGGEPDVVVPALTDEQQTEQLIDARQAVDALRDDPDAMQQLAAYALQIAAERHV